MPSDVRELLPLYVLGLLGTDETATVERALRRDPALVAELRAYDDAAASLLAGVEPVAPPAGLRDRLIASTQPRPGRFERFAARFAAIYDVTVERARELMGLIDDPTTYDMQLGTAALVHFQGGPACAGADCGLILMRPGAKFPWHRHDGDELVLVLQGALVEENGNVLRAGDEDSKGNGSEHTFIAAEGDDLIFCARVWGVDFDVERPS